MKIHRTLGELLLVAVCLLWCHRGALADHLERRLAPVEPWIEAAQAPDDVNAGEPAGEGLELSGRGAEDGVSLVLAARDADRGA